MSRVRAPPEGAVRPLVSCRVTLVCTREMYRSNGAVLMSTNWLMDMSGPVMRRENLAGRLRVSGNQSYNRNVCSNIGDETAEATAIARAARAQNASTRTRSWSPSVSCMRGGHR